MGHVKKRNALHTVLSSRVVTRCGAYRFDDFTITFVHKMLKFGGVRAKLEGVDAFFSIRRRAKRKMQKAMLSAYLISIITSFRRMKGNVHGGL